MHCLKESDQNIDSTIPPKAMVNDEDLGKEKTCMSTSLFHNWNFEASVMESILLKYDFEKEFSYQRCESTKVSLGNNLQRIGEPEPSFCSDDSEDTQFHECFEQLQNFLLFWDAFDISTT
jgi:hypothetical protein